MMGASALVMGAMFTACSNDEGVTAEEYYQALYNQAFEKAFGKVSPNQDWGFGPSGSTRSENANANEWADPNKAYGGLKVPPPLTEEQIAVVKEYFQTVKNPTYEDPHWTNYFMQQVYKGYTDPRAGYSPEAYLAANGSTYLYASDYMDHLAAIDGDFVDHINNFNHGDCSLNGTVLDNGGNANEGPFHSDKIMYMKESTTKSFGYYNSNGSVRRTEYTGLVSFQTIINKLGSKANCLNDGWNRSFMGFDFEQMIDDQILAKELDYSAGWSADIPGGFPVKDYIWFEHKGEKYHMLVAEQNMYCGTPLDITDDQARDEAFIDNLLAQGYLPVTGGAGKKWVKVGGCADGYYSDWIVCLTKAETNGIVPGGPTKKNIRIMAEDLSANEASDFDFNDVVFDVEWTFAANETSTNKVKVTLWAAGGTLPLKINSVGGAGGFEVHNALGVSEIKTMINTHAKDRAGTYKEKDANGVVQEVTYYWLDDAKDNNPYEETITLANGASISKDDFETDVNTNLRVEVQKNGKWYLLTAERGTPACKFGCPVGTPWAMERHNMDNAFTDFKSWVNNSAPTTWYNSKVTEQVYNAGMSVICVHGQH